MATHKKKSSYSWDRSGVRQIQFKALKAGEKIGFGLGGDGQRQEIVSVKDGTQAYWKGVKTGYKIVAVNGVKVDAITVKSAIKNACSLGQGFVVGMSTGEIIKLDDKKVSKVKAKRTSKAAKKSRAPRSAKKPATNVDESKEEIPQGYEDEKPIVDNGEFNYQEETDVGGWFAGDDQADDYIPVDKL